MTDDDAPPPQQQPRNPFHGVTLERMLTELVDELGWEELGRRIRIRCFSVDPSLKSSLGFLRQTPWARDKVETLYLKRLMQREREARRRAGQDRG